jgi:ABC-type phosphate transport system substrate-binding protein
MLAIVSLLALALLAGCGVSIQGGSGSPSRNRVIAGEDGQAQLPPRPPGVIRIGGATDVAPTDALLESYRRTAPGITVQAGGSTESEGFADFCRGSVDIVASARSISAQEYEDCRRRGVEPVQIQLASDAVVLAIRNETNVGVDCLTLGEVQEIFRAGSPISNWSQVGFLSTANTSGLAPPVKVTGPNPESSLFTFFSSIVLGTALPSATSVRGDYTPHADARGVRLQVIGGDNQRLRLAQRSESSRKVLRGQQRSLVDARRAVEEAQLQVRKGIRDRRTEAARAADQRRLAAALVKLARIEARLPNLRDRSRIDIEAARRLRQARGTLGLFGFTYYEVWEEQLRPMEINTRSAAAAQPNCVFPSTQTVSDASYPLARQALMTVSLQRLREAEIQVLLTFAVRNAAGAAEKLGLVELPGERRDQQLDWIAGETRPEVIFYPVSAGRSTTEATEGAR